VRIALPVCVAALIAVAGCAGGRGELASPGRVRGRVEAAQRLPQGAYVEVLRIDGNGVAIPDPFERVTPDALGRFSTNVLSPGRYRLVLRRPDAPPSAVTVHVPTGELAVLRSPIAVDGVTLSVKSKEHEPVRCVLTEVSPGDGLADVREFECTDRLPATVRGLRPGRFYLDLPERGLTTELDVPAGVPQRDLVLDPPPAGGIGGVAGQVRRTGGDAAAWLVVAARPLGDDGAPAERWGRYATTDRTGSFSLAGIPAGRALVRVETRAWPAGVLPAPRAVAIPPSGMIELGFEVGP
jgi:hypothetical protein